MVTLTQAALGGGSKDGGEVGLDEGDLDKLSEQQIYDLKEMLGDDFPKQYPDYI